MSLLLISAATAVGYLYSTKTQGEQAVKIIPTPVPLPTNIPPPSPTGKTQILEEFYDNEDQWTVTSIETILSPDKSKIFLRGQGGISPPILYWSLVSNPDLKKTGVAVKVAWSHNSKYIAYISRHGDCGPADGLGVYDTQINQGVNISTKPKIPDLEYNSLGFEDIGWINNDQAIKVKYTAYKDRGVELKLWDKGRYQFHLRVSNQ